MCKFTLWQVLDDELTDPSRLQNLSVVNQHMNAPSPEVILLNPKAADRSSGGTLGIYHEGSKKAYLPASSEESGIPAVPTYQAEIPAAS